MDFQKLKTQIQETEKLIEREIDTSSPSRSGLEMQRNQALTALGQLKVMEKNALKNYSNLYLLVGAKEQLLSAFESQGCIVVDHLSLAKTVAVKFWPQFQPGMSLNSFIVDQINQYMDTLAQHLGLDTFIRPKLQMDALYMNAIQNEDELSQLLELMFESQLKNQLSDVEGHVLQAIFATNELMKQYGTFDKVSQNVNFVVSVPSVCDDVIDAYKNLLSSNIFTATFKSKLDLSDEKKVLETVKSVLKKKENKEV